MKSMLLKLRTATFILVLGISSSIYSYNDQVMIESSIKEVFSKFEESVDLFKQQLSGLLDPNSNEKLKSTCAKINTAIEQAATIFIDPIRQEVQELNQKNLSYSDYCKLLTLLLKVGDELKGHFDLLHKTLNNSLQGKPSAIRVAKTLKPVVDKIIANQNFIVIDNYLEQAYKIALSYDITIEIKPQYRKMFDENDADNTVHEIHLAQAFAIMREALEELRKECQTTTLSAGELLRIIRKRL
ncbi:MAG: hypothetical protein WD055_02225 [Candidatus Dependentiae bacterium]